MIETFINKSIDVLNILKINQILKNVFEKIFFLYFLIIFFFWSVDYIIFDAKYFTGLIFFLSLITYPKNLHYLKNKNFLLVIFFFIIHLIFILSKSDSIFFNNILYYSYVIISILTLILLYDLLKRNFLNLITAFIFIFNSFFILFILIYLIKSGNFNIDCYNGIFSETNFIFNENSHFGLISSAVILYNSNVIFEDQILKYRKFFIINTIIFSFISFLSVSTSFLIILLFLSSIFLIKNRLFKKRVFYIGLIIICSLFLNFKDQCNYRSFENLKDIINFKVADKSVQDSQTTVDEIIVPKKSLSYKVFINSIKIGVLTLPENLIGVGINNYNKLFERHNINITFSEEEVNYLNIEDASNNFSKIIGEFGIFGLLFYIFIILRIIKIDPANSFQIFMITAILSQSLRGVGYFNAAFVFLAATLLMSLYDKNFKKK